MTPKDPMRLTLTALQPDLFSTDTVRLGLLPPPPPHINTVVRYSLRRWWRRDYRHRPFPHAKLRSQGSYLKTVWPQTIQQTLSSNAFGRCWVLLLAQDSRKTGLFVQKLLDALLPESGPRPPLYKRYREAEIELSRRMEDRPEFKYVFFADYMRRKCNFHCFATAVNITAGSGRTHLVKPPNLRCANICLICAQDFMDVPHHLCFVAAGGGYS